MFFISWSKAADGYPGQNDKMGDIEAAVCCFRLSAKDRTRPMTIYFQRGDAASELDEKDFREALDAAFRAVGTPQKVLAVPPDHTRHDSRAGDLTRLAYELLGDRLSDVIPALGTHRPMNEAELQMMFGDLPRHLIRVHDWQNDVITLGEVDAEFVARATDGLYQSPWSAQVNRLLVEGKYDLILSLGQVVPHEVIGMANYNKNIFIGTGGHRGINESHYLSALYGMERIMGRCDTPLRKILNEAQDRFCQTLPLLFVLTVIEALTDGRKIVRGLFVGDSHDVFVQAGELSAKVNRMIVQNAPKTVVVTMKPSKYKRTWIANKAIYRTRMLVAPGGKLVIVAPGVEGFGESPTVDHLIRKYGYRDTSQILRWVSDNRDLQENLGTAAHLIHGSTEGKFEVIYAPGKLSRSEVEEVGYQWADWREIQQQYQCGELVDGWHTSPTGEPFYYINDPGLGLWVRSDHPHRD
jgi:nickel-dependent lactate racemase